MDRTRALQQWWQQLTPADRERARGARGGPFPPDLVMSLESTGLDLDLAPYYDGAGDAPTGHVVPAEVADFLDTAPQ